ncbi:prolyl-tRNA synthetase-like protein [Lindgomyces ingoldianus]|uniref:Prolyl-tRNA synthetase-like protein n=1 Tax=Lindgomyces ingoldianus TaxID=673940 RepID=A0ACB6QYB0_9PLEO|nr:prolyl-tRNA synthetase-like protein [Lindgomyces ingoldianus]KAF2472008.1 prolyl-tRNA synthetase-like protein [Lindgomyces ingoldianus]
MPARLGYGLRRCNLQKRRGFQNARLISVDSRNRLSNFWTPTGGISPQDGEQDDSHALLVRGGFLRQAHSGVFHLLPLGLRVQERLSWLIDKHMATLGASKLSLSSITTEALWRQSGRYSANSELLRLSDRKDSGFLLSPTHEEEITSLVAGMVHSYKDLPLKLYQIGRKYRDERRPRQGLLRAKEFLMKDLYTFDYAHEHALQTYQSVRTAYNNFFDELKLPYLVADADSGNMGGKLSHEYHFVSPKGEDNVWSCSSCDYVANEELVEKRTHDTGRLPTSQELHFTGISVDRTTKIHIHVPYPARLVNVPCSDGTKLNVYVPRPDILPPSLLSSDSTHIEKFVNLHAVKKAAIDIDTGIEKTTLQSFLPKTTKTIHIYDRLVPYPKYPDSEIPLNHLDITRIYPGDPCPRCESGELKVQKAIEVAHTFHLGTRYSEPLKALVAGPDGMAKQPMQMGCHGIGVSRLIGAIASLLADDKGLNWPRVIAPFECIVVTTPQVPEEDGVEVYDILREGAQGYEIVDTVIDDRPIKSLAWKLRDADLIGYPVIVVLGRAWKERRRVEVQCRRHGVKTEMELEGLKEGVLKLLDLL